MSRLLLPNKFKVKQIRYVITVKKLLGPVSVTSFFIRTCVLFSRDISKWEFYHNFYAFYLIYW